MLTFKCGCTLDENFFNIPEVEQWDFIPKNCPETWGMIGEGLTKGVFQLEKSLGRRWCKKIKPTSVGELADVISLIRPGCLEAEYRENPDTGKMMSITDTYAKIRAGKIQPEYIHPSLEPILKDTYGVPIYQEQIMNICSDFAGFSLVDADNARKAVGKKDLAKMDIVHKDFVEMAVARGHDRGVAETIFSWIDKFSGYGFNKSHAVGYAQVGYWTAFAKVHFPKEFFKSMLTFSSSKMDGQDEIKQLVHEARLFGISIRLPDVREGNEDFSFSDDGDIVFGLSHIKNVGQSVMTGVKRLKTIKNERELFYRYFCANKDKLNKRAIEALIKSGALDHALDSRIKTLGRFRMMGVLTSREVAHIFDSDEDLFEMSAEGWRQSLIDNNIPRPLDKRLERIDFEWKQIMEDLSGNRYKIGLGFEKFHLGMAISGSEVDLYDNARCDVNCINFLKIRNKSSVCMGVMVEEIRKVKDRRGNDMCFLKVSDSTYMLDNVVVFASAYLKSGHLLDEGKVVMLNGKKDDTSLLVNSINHI